MTIAVDRAGGRLLSCSFADPIPLPGLKDPEGCAWDAFSRTLWVSDEKTATVKEFRLAPVAALRTLPVPPVFKKARRNLSLEALTLSEDGRTLWFANEEPLACDGPRASVTNAGLVRLARYVRAAPERAWAVAGQWAYATERLNEAANPTRLNRCGISSLLALGEGRLLALEREMSGFFFHWRIYEIDFAAATPVATLPSLEKDALRPVGKKLLAAGKERYSLLRPNGKLANYEGLCLGPRLADGRRVLLMIADAGDRFSVPLLKSFVLNP
jgi:hypothetical protein